MNSFAMLSWHNTERRKERLNPLTISVTHLYFFFITELGTRVSSGLITLTWSLISRCSKLCLHWRVASICPSWHCTEITSTNYSMIYLINCHIIAYTNSPGWLPFVPLVTQVCYYQQYAFISVFVTTSVLVCGSFLFQVWHWFQKSRSRKTCKWRRFFVDEKLDFILNL